MKFFDKAAMTGEGRDFRFFLDQTPRERILPGILALLIPGIIVFIFIIDSKVNTAPPPGPKVIYFESWPLSRTDEEILKDRWAIQCLKDEAMERRRQSMKELGRMSGMDVEKIEREAKARKLARGDVEDPRPAGLKC
ncbi:hypothetical protein [Parasphingorhabdus halotolerans]|uniref:Uncharacterized protein n=1 Tax=Parasphingorhabdus halotolerans TaxID=2725558 RepID=A0A6H2DPY0_9SPHN|nr:hypothetical protein [Parasphingorhabdus halotolerans]QJB69726.1 hypothetical protein HF685_10920 [Parasphingorhabdus halotolerans]